jgi:hypothetical protein
MLFLLWFYYLPQKSVKAKDNLGTEKISYETKFFMNN